MSDARVYVRWSRSYLCILQWSLSTDQIIHIRTTFNISESSIAASKMAQLQPLSTEQIEEFLSQADPHITLLGLDADLFKNLKLHAVLLDQAKTKVLTTSHDVDEWRRSVQRWDSGLGQDYKAKLHDLEVQEDAYKRLRDMWRDEGCVCGTEYGLL
jgi:hypothetical protein